MKIAVCYSGQLRIGRGAFANQCAFFGDLLPEIDFFVHTWDINTNKRFYNYHGYIAPIVFEEYFDMLKPKAAKVEKFLSVFSFDANTYKHQPLYYGWKQSVILKQEYEKANGFVYDAVVKLRPDIIFPTDRNLRMHVNDAIEYNSMIIENIQTDDTWKTSIFNDDVMYIAPSTLMDFAVTYFDNAPKGKLLLHYLHENNIPFKAGHHANRGNDRGYAIYRDECQYLDPLTQFPECMECEYLYFRDANNPFYHPYQSQSKFKKLRP